MYVYIHACMYALSLHVHPWVLTAVGVSGLRLFKNGCFSPSRAAAFASGIGETKRGKLYVPDPPLNRLRFSLLNQANRSTWGKRGIVHIINTHIKKKKHHTTTHTTTTTTAHTRSFLFSPAITCMCYHVCMYMSTVFVGLVCRRTWPQHGSRPRQGQHGNNCH